MTENKVWASSNIFPLCLEYMMLLYGSQIRRQKIKCGSLRIYSFYISSTWFCCTEGNNIFPLRLEHMTLLNRTQIRQHIVSVGLFQYIPPVSRAHGNTKEKKCGTLPIYSSVSRAHWSCSRDGQIRRQKIKCGPLPIYPLYVSSTWSCSTEAKSDDRLWVWTSSNIFPLCLEHMIYRSKKRRQI